MNRFQTTMLAVIGGFVGAALFAVLQTPSAEAATRNSRHGARTLSVRGIKIIDDRGVERGYLGIGKDSTCLLLADGEDITVSLAALNNGYARVAVGKTTGALSPIGFSTFEGGAAISLARPNGMQAISLISGRERAIVSLCHDDERDAGVTLATANGIAAISLGRKGERDPSWVQRAE